MKGHGIYIVLEEFYEDSSLYAKKDALTMSSTIALAATRQGECKSRAAPTLNISLIADLVLSKRFMSSGIFSMQMSLLHRFSRPRMRQIELHEAQPDVPQFGDRLPSQKEMVFAYE